MLEIYGETNLDRCRLLWEQLIPPERLTDLWDVRSCFHTYFKRDPFFVVAKKNGQPVGLIPLSWIPESNCYGYFPGEVWHGKTWLEQNRLIAPDQVTLLAMLHWLKKQKKNYCLRYLLENFFLSQDMSVVDEIGYLFHPKLFQYNMDNFFAQFSAKSRQGIRDEIKNFRARNLSTRIDHLGDYDLMVAMNIERFAQDSYFVDERFTSSFRALMNFAKDKGWLRMTTFMVEGEPVAADMGVVYNNAYTLLAGGTHGDFPGIAKIINLHHMKRACEQKYNEADFLCGDFSWKKIFHLTQRPLYIVSNTN